LAHADASAKKGPVLDNVVGSPADALCVGNPRQKGLIITFASLSPCDINPMGLQMVGPSDYIRQAFLGSKELAQYYYATTTSYWMDRSCGRLDRLIGIA
jgi:hypothetical protein